MSRIGKLPLTLPEGVSVKQEGLLLSFSGKKGSLAVQLHPLVQACLESNALTFTPKDESASARALWGTMRALAANAVKGVSEGFSQSLELKGVGFRVALKGRSLEMNLGYSHPVIFELPEGVDGSCPNQTEIELVSACKQKLGQTASEVRRLCPPEPYKGKGIRYKGQFVRMKEGKKK